MSKATAPKGTAEWHYQIAMELIDISGDADQSSDTTRDCLLAAQIHASLAQYRQAAETQRPRRTLRQWYGGDWD